MACLLWREEVVDTDTFEDSAGLMISVFLTVSESLETNKRAKKLKHPIFDVFIGC
jgi:hypothetical protein